MKATGIRRMVTFGKMNFISVLLVSGLLTLFFIDDAFPALIPPFFLDCVVAIGVNPPGSLDFTIDEFNNQEKDAHQLCQVIKSDYKLEGNNADEGCLNRLNRILQLPNLYDRIVANKTNVVMTGMEIEELVYFLKISAD